MNVWHFTSFFIATWVTTLNQQYISNPMDLLIKIYGLFFAKEFAEFRELSWCLNQFVFEFILVRINWCLIDVWIRVEAELMYEFVFGSKLCAVQQFWPKKMWTLGKLSISKAKRGLLRRFSVKYNIWITEAKKWNIATNAANP